MSVAGTSTRSGLALAAALLILACDGTPVEAPPEAGLPHDARIEIHSGNDQIGPSEMILPSPLEVRVTTPDGRPVPGARIRWTPAPSALSLGAGATPYTDTLGINRVRLNLGRAAGTHLTIATIEGTEKQVQFTTTVLVQGATRLTPIPGDPASFTDTVLSSRSHRVLALDHNDQPAPGVQVSWTTSRGTLSGATSVTNADGIAEIVHEHPFLVGTASVFARVVGLIGSPVIVSSRAVPGRPAAIGKLGGDEQFGVTGKPLPEPFVVNITDGYTNPITGVDISWTLASETGPIHLATDTSALDPFTGASAARAAYRHATAEAQGRHVVTASAPDHPHVPAASFTFTALNEVPIYVPVSDEGDYWGCYYEGVCAFPENLTVSSGRAVAWQWIGSDAHDIVFEDDPTPPTSSLRQGTGTHLRIFTEPGTYRYRCTAHSTSFTEGAFGQVTVE